MCSTLRRALSRIVTRFSGDSMSLSVWPTSQSSNWCALDCVNMLSRQSYYHRPTVRFKWMLCLVQLVHVACELAYEYGMRLFPLEETGISFQNSMGIGINMNSVELMHTAYNRGRLCSTTNWQLVCPSVCLSRSFSVSTTKWIKLVSGADTTLLCEEIRFPSH